MTATNHDGNTACDVTEADDEDLRVLLCRHSETASWSNTYVLR